MGFMCCSTGRLHHIRFQGTNNNDLFIVKPTRDHLQKILEGSVDDEMFQKARQTLTWPVYTRVKGNRHLYDSF